MKVLSLRLRDEDFGHIEELKKIEKTDQSQIARELINEGWKFRLLCMYKRGKLSLGSMAKELKMPLSQTLDFLEELGTPAPLEYEDYLQGLDLLREEPAKKVPTSE